MFQCRSLRMSAKRGFYEGIMIPTALYGAETWYVGGGGAERKRLNIGELRYLRSMYGETRMDRVRHEEARRRPGFSRELADRVLRWFQHVERME